MPPKPLEIPESVRSQIGTDAERERERGRVPSTYRYWLGPWYEERSGEFRFRTAFPFWFERRMPKGDRASLYGGFYYNRRSPTRDADVLFPLYWNLRSDKTRTTVVGPFARRTGPSGNDLWLAPLFFSGARSDGGGYLHIPPLLTFTSHTQDSGFNWAGLLYYCSWKGGPSCNPKRNNDVDYGLAPLFFAGKDDRTRYELAPPLLHYFRYNEVEDSALNIWGPLVWSHEKEREAFNVFPFFFHSWAKNEERVTVFPLFHYGYKGAANLLATPLFVNSRGEDGSRTFATYLYARHRGRTELDMFTPLVWHYRDPDVNLSRWIIPPFYYSSSSPRGDDLAVFPFYAHSRRPDLRETTWITPFFSHTHDLTGWSTNIYPFVFAGRTHQSTHTVLFPFFWDFASPDSRATVAFPLVWRFADRDSVKQLLGNVYYREKRLPTGLDWEVHIFPAFSYGETPDGHWWNVLFGLAGYTRSGPMTQVRVAYVPITVSE